MGAPWTPDQLLDYLGGLEIDVSTVTHPPVFTVEESRRLRPALPGGHCKSLFLRGAKHGWWLVVAPAGASIDLKRLGGLLASGRLSFAPRDAVQRRLGVVPGAVSPFAVVNDPEGTVTVVLDRSVLGRDPLHFHPLDNRMTTAISAADLVRFLEASGHPPRWLEAATQEDN